MSLSLVQGLLSEVGFAPSAASVEHVNGPTLPIISRSYVDTEFHGSLNSPVVNFADSNESLVVLEVEHGIVERLAATLAFRRAHVPLTVCVSRDHLQGHDCTAMLIALVAAASSLRMLSRARSSAASSVVPQPSAISWSPLKRCTDQ